jgi:hypothetical protein
VFPNQHFFMSGPPPSIKDWLLDLPLWQARPLVSNLGHA